MSGADTSAGVHDTTDAAAEARERARIQQMAEDVVDAIDSIKPGADHHVLPALDLPGFGDPYDDCGEDVPYFCLGCGKPTGVGRCCGRSTCPRCAPKWALERAEAVGGKIDALGRLLTSRTGRHHKTHHLVVSEPSTQTYASKDRLHRAFKAVKEIMNALGIQGQVIYHPYRGRSEEIEHEYAGEVLVDTTDDETDDGVDDDGWFGQYDSTRQRDRAKAEKNGDDRGAWKGRLFNDRPWTSADTSKEHFSGDPVRDELVFSPHFHIVGVSEFVQGEDLTDKVYDETGWIIHRITKPGSNVSIYDQKDLARVLTYCYSHAGIRELDDGSHRVAARQVGADYNAVTAREQNQLEFEAVARAISPQTLGLAFDQLACQAEDHGAAELKVGLTAAASSSSTSSSSYDESQDLGPDVDGDATGEVQIGVGGVTDAVTNVPDDPPVDVDLPTPTRCEGRLAHISKAKPLLLDEDWVERAPFAKELAETYRDWHDEQELERLRAKQRRPPDPPPDDVDIG